MASFIQTVLNTSEVWAVLIPLLYLAFSKKIDTQPIREIAIYLWVAFLLNFIIVLISYLPDYYSSDEIPAILANNTIEYNLHSICRVMLFGWFYTRTTNDSLKRFKKIILGAFFLFVLVNFSAFESPVTLLSSRLFTAEAIILLFFCIYYYLNSIIDERQVKLIREPVFWFTIGLSIYEAVNFLIFLLFTYLVNNYTYFAQRIWNFHNISYIIFCLFITKALHESRRK